ncbi:MAG: Si-specific NAD(P)(+) transhydrogenase [Deltaproteobacteria bacterium]|nr:Si-specific NAD(P)(+) transhydrogenase [Deltaproteobacteria bacterium]
MSKYDLIVIGSGPAGEKAAIQSAKLDKRVLMVERRESPGGNSLHTGTIPSKTLRESVRFISTMRQRAIYGINVRVDKDLTVDRLMHRKNAAIVSLSERLESSFERNQVEQAFGSATFLDPHRIEVRQPQGNVEIYEGEHFVIATGSRPYRPDFLDFTHERIRDSDTILGMHHIPRTLTIIGAGVIGCEYATIFSNLGVKVNLVNPRKILLDFLDLEMSNALGFLMRENGVRIRLGEDLQGVTTDEHFVYAHTESDKVIKSDVLLFANGRTGNTDNLGLENIGIAPNSRKQLEVNAFYQTSVPHVYAVGDVIGFPALASTSMEQGRMAALHCFGEVTTPPLKHLLPTGIYTIPEISMVGSTEEQLTQQKVPYEVGAATYREIARGQIVGNTTGRLKLLFHRESLKLLGVHIIGDQATEMIHIGQTVMAFDGSIEFFINQVFNYPTYSECYRVAALNGVNRL